MIIFVCLHFQWTVPTTFCKDFFFGACKIIAQGALFVFFFMVLAALIVSSTSSETLHKCLLPFGVIYLVSLIAATFLVMLYKVGSHDVNKHPVLMNREECSDVVVV